jgi:DNA topoisomerase I
LNKAKAPSSKKPKLTKAASDSDDDIPLAAKSKPKPVRKSTTPVVKKTSVKPESSDSDNDVPLAREKSKPVKRTKPESDSDDDIPLASKSKKPKLKQESSVKQEPNAVKKSSVKKRFKEEDLDAKPEEEDEEYRWWEAGQNDGTVKWTTLEHNGVLFPPPYEPLPKHIKMKYDGKEVSLPPEAEEVAGFFASLIETDHGKNPVFQQNFFNDWLQVLKEHNAVFSKVMGG